MKNRENIPITPEDYLIIRASMQGQINRLQRVIDKARQKVDRNLPANRRPATAADIKVGQIIYYEHGDDGPFWTEVEQVLRPDDAFKAYTATDGSRYGLDDAWIKTK